MTEGRRAFLRRVSGIERGAECARYEPLLSALADGEASAEDLAHQRPHMQTCLSCRAALREFRAMPHQVASVLPPAALVASDGGGPLRSLLESVLGAAQHKTAALGDRLQAATELATGQKIAAVAASAAALAGGGTAMTEFANHKGPRLPEPVQQVETQPVEEESPVEPAPPPSAEAPPADPAPEPAGTPAPGPAPPPPDPANEFAPGAGAVPAASEPSALASAPAQPAEGEFTSKAGGGAGGGGGAGEFAP